MLSVHWKDFTSTSHTQMFLILPSSSDKGKSFAFNGRPQAINWECC